VHHVAVVTQQRRTMTQMCDVAIGQHDGSTSA